MSVPTRSRANARANARAGARARGWARLRRLAVDDRGMSTAEYAIGTVAAAGFAALLYVIFRSDTVVGALTDIIQRALSTAF